ncbi:MULTISPECIES: zinc-binding alcohol dehydrogenase family protein [unclassified Cupriavidus]|uniref:zinc-binding alcohol dehydrogenase family protein n=1 Tax=unclassified Cupriavidus TaxID=2640874 RepID=UPI001C00775C|nr:MULTISPECIES: zinc-binding alcohol dehydrogenase family protein [unclassified Cupriavidus]MCA3187075.1 zinc-binding alcohol dehydrogenase family protein [Cupriavidus sp.]MCA3194249.1 zinc-binding alcohol dehydrogenase family protein [Cupriavidus sp.]MCA3194785.1 zinc-binding alcohol dehydrogenase family protein [Cupriavidus sp.]MCA3233005.1 zinc-binding alcohol dehydrogenase family protein [Cupriavidus sp.]QWE96476.1 zinc-binding alcohol dehydrogenase family protein [Cupriavidus sp. EM10]
MKAIVYDKAGLPIDDPRALYEMELPRPEPQARDLLVRIEAIAVNPVDSKLRLGVQPNGPRVLGWDAVGTVEAVGEAVELFKVGDKVWYAGDITRQGSYAEYGLVDERIAGHCPKSLKTADAAALPLTSITAWELLFDRLRIPEAGGHGQSLLVIGASGGVGSILVQLARKLTGLTVIGTASRPESRKWVMDLGAHLVIDHSQPLQPQLTAGGIHQVDHVISLTHTDSYYAQIVELLKPQGQLALIDDPATLDAMPLKRKSISLHWEFMFTRSMYRAADMVDQHKLLDRVAALLDEGVLKTTVGEHFGDITVDNLRRAHAVLESSRAVGKIVLARS